MATMPPSRTKQPKLPRWIQTIKARSNDRAFCLVQFRETYQ